MRHWCVFAATAGLGGCIAASPQSALHPAGDDAASILWLFTWMSIGAAIVWVLVMAVGWYCVRGPRRQQAERAAPTLIVGGGVLVPAVVLGGLLVMGLAPLPALLEVPDDPDLDIEVEGELWWWRIRYRTPGGVIETANELRLPAGRRALIRLSSDNVVHAFWVPALSGKVDMLPGRTTHITLEPRSPGNYRGVCAEFCGVGHARMALHVRVDTAEAFDAWLASESAAAVPPASADARAGQRVFDQYGCDACHAVRGTSARGSVGPDLTHLGRRAALAADTVPNDTEHLARWIANPARVKAGARMPSFAAMPAESLRLVTLYLRGLQ